MLRTIAHIEEEIGDEYEDVGDIARSWAAVNEVQLIDGQFVLTADEYAAFVAWLEGEDDDATDEEDGETDGEDGETDEEDGETDDESDAEDDD